MQVQQDLNPPVKVKYTTAEVKALGIQSVNPIPEPIPCKFCGKLLDHEGILFGGKIITWWNMPQRCDCEKAQKWWAEYDRTQELKSGKNRKPKKPENSKRGLNALSETQESADGF